MAFLLSAVHESGTSIDESEVLTFKPSYRHWFVWGNFGLSIHGNLNRVNVVMVDGKEYCTAMLGFFTLTISTLLFCHFPLSVQHLAFRFIALWAHAETLLFLSFLIPRLLEHRKMGRASMRNSPSLSQKRWVMEKDFSVTSMYNILMQHLLACRRVSSAVEYRLLPRQYYPAPLFSRTPLRLMYAPRGFFPRSRRRPPRS